MPLVKKKVDRRKSMSRKEISLARLENFRREVITDDHSVPLTINFILKIAHNFMTSCKLEYVTNDSSVGLEMPVKTCLYENLKIRRPNFVLEQVSCQKSI
ncbi:hypothetical protein GWI33_023080 [Rhynchophorus ferrugineus]|uniref:Uncharacterized protein n=1 Tax=Rhynchophorus ferrugineus TaxID=354439 RepID=A0A834HN04_RHYFE|nr:hypothetical protein GWI33_023080 [Rhynchophorus ferrugineus]